MKIKRIVQILIFVIISFILMILARFLLKNDFKPFMSWWLVLVLLGVLFLPLTKKIFARFHDNGYLFSKTIGIALSGYIMWFLSSIKLVRFSSTSCIAIVGIFAVINLLIFIKDKRTKKSLCFERKKIVWMIVEELMFFTVLLIWTYIRGFKPEAYGTEKFMDYGFMTIMMRSDYMPPQDLWFSGNVINYYYVGQFFATFLTKLSLVKVNVGYNLMLMTLATFGFMLPFSIIYNVTKNYLFHREKKARVAPIFAGLLSGAGVSLAGNMHFILFYWIVPIIRDILGIESDDHFWFPDSTRYIGYHPETTDKTIHEFPNYSFVLGDLHAHVLNIIFVLTVLGILFAWLLYQRDQINKVDKNNMTLLTLIRTEVINPYIILISFFVGLFLTTNFWDFPIYFVVTGGIVLFYNIRQYVLLRKSFLITLIQGIIVLAIGMLIALPFTLNFKFISDGISTTVARTPIYQIIILWGLPISLIIGLLVDVITRYKMSLLLSSSRDKDNKKGFKHFLEYLDYSDYFVLILGLCAIGLVIMPEVIYVRDIYSGDYKRANTMFKLTYQAFILFGLCSGYIFVKFMTRKRLRWQNKFIIMTLLLFLSSVWYTKVSVDSWYGNIFKIKNYKGLDAAAFMSTDFPDDYSATNWLNDNVEGTPVILEANGDSYSDYQRVSVITGLPTVVGWYVHEWLWRGDSAIVDERRNDVTTLYTSTDKEEVLNLIHKYQIEYIYVGKLEKEKFSNLNNSLLKELGDIVYESSETEKNNYETYIIHVK